MERFVKIAPKPSQYQSQSLDVDLFGQRKPDKRQSFDLIKIMRETLFSKYGRDPWVDELPININKSELAKKKKEVIDELKADDEEIVESEVNYLWKCAIFSLRNWAILSQINAKHKISVWYIRKLLDGVIPENLIHAALEAWLKEAKPTSARLVEIKENVLHASQIEPKDLRYLDQTKDKKIQSLQYEVENWRLKYESVYAELQKFKISEERNLQVLSAMRAEVLECQQENSNLKRQIAQLRQFESLQEKRLKNLEKNSSLSILSPNKISTPQTVKPSQNETEDSVIHREDVAAQNISSIDGIAPLDQSIEEALNFSEPILDKAAEKLEACLMASIPSESNNISVETDFNVIAETEVHDEPIGNPEPIFNTVETITQRIDVEVDVEKLELTRRAIKIEKTTSKKKKSTAIEKKTVTKKPKTDDKTVESVPENIDVAKKELHVGDWVCVCWRDAGAYFGKVTDIDKNKNICDATFLKRKFGNMYNMSTLTESFEMSQVIAFSFDVVYESKNAWKVTFNEKMLKDLFKKWKYESFL